MANAFTKAVKAAVEAPTPKKTEGEVIVPPESDIRAAVDNYIDAKTKIKNAETDKELAGSTVLPFARKEFIRRFVDNGFLPEKLRIAGDVSQVALVVQNRCGNYAISKEQDDTLKTLLGDQADGLVHEVTEFSFDTTILNLPGVMDKLGAAIEGLVNSKVLTREQVDRLLKAESRRVVKEDTLPKLAEICKRNPQLVEDVIGALGSNVAIYVK